jgi:acyl-CoA synthetase (AMP-forming)/AMP-acid ligase II
VLQEDGYGRIVGRLKDMIIRIGDKIFPVEIEEFFTGHPDILEAQVKPTHNNKINPTVVHCICCTTCTHLSHQNTSYVNELDASLSYSRKPIDGNYSKSVKLCPHVSKSIYETNFNIIILVTSSFPMYHRYNCIVMCMSDYRQGCD